MQKTKVSRLIYKDMYSAVRSATESVVRSAVNSAVYSAVESSLWHAVALDVYSTATYTPKEIELVKSLV